MTQRKSRLLTGVGWGVVATVAMPLLMLIGASVTPAIAGATLLLHLVYGGVLGALVDRGAAPSSAPDPGVKDA